MLVITYPHQSWIPRAPPDVTIYITELLDIRALVCVRLTCSNGDQYVSAVLCRRMRMKLRPYFDRYMDFVQEMRFTGAVVGGQMALNVLYPDINAPNGMTLFLPNRLFFHMLGYLTSVEGYNAVLATRKCDTRALQARTCTATLSRGHNVIDLIQSATESPLYALYGTSTTASSAYFSPTSFCDPYPLLNAARQALVDPRQSYRASIVRWPYYDEVLRLRKQGWTVAVHVAELELRGPCQGRPRSDCAAAVRYFGDKNCVAGPLFPVRGRPELRPTLLVDMVQVYTVMWWRGGRVCAPGCQGNLTRVVPGANTVYRQQVIGL